MKPIFATGSALNNKEMSERIQNPGIN